MKGWQEALLTIAVFVCGVPVAIVLLLFVSYGLCAPCSFLIYGNGKELGDRIVYCVGWAGGGCIGHAPWESDGTLMVFGPPDTTARPSQSSAELSHV